MRTQYDDTRGPTNHPGWLPRTVGTNMSLSMDTALGAVERVR